MSSIGRRLMSTNSRLVVSLNKVFFSILYLFVVRLCRIFLSLFSFSIFGAFGQDLFPCRNFQVRSLAADPVKALASLAVEPMEVLLGGGEDDDDDDDIYIMMKCLSVCVSRKIITS